MLQFYDLKDVLFFMQDLDEDKPYNLSEYSTRLITKLLSSAHHNGMQQGRSIAS